MITPQYAQVMARYNSWQNGQVSAAMGKLDAEALRLERGAFFGSILKTASHLLWGDLIWMSRFDGGAAPSGGISGSTGLVESYAGWAQNRRALDERIEGWAMGLSPVEIAGDLVWYSGVTGREMMKPKALAIVHMFNHQTHHRGQIHAMLTAAGEAPGDTDLPFGPDLMAGS